MCPKPCKQSISKQFNHGDYKYINITHIYVPSTSTPQIPPHWQKNQADCATGFEFRITNLANNNQHDP